MSRLTIEASTPLCLLQDPVRRAFLQGLLFRIRHEIDIARRGCLSSWHRVRVAAE